ncbi:MAG TPA: FAD-dependent monooxygenase, partial [Candidatus Limnocylindrales bacterium]
AASPITIRTSVPIQPWQPTSITLLGDAIHTMTPGQGVGANTALRDAALLTRQLSQVAQHELALLEAIGEYEAEMRDYGFQAVDLALRTLRQGLASNPVEVFLSRNWFRLCGVAAPLRRMTFGGSWARVSAPRGWERAATGRQDAAVRRR